MGRSIPARLVKSVASRCHADVSLDVSDRAASGCAKTKVCRSGLRRSTTSRRSSDSQSPRDRSQPAEKGRPRARVEPVPASGNTPGLPAGGIPGVRKTPHMRIAAAANASANSQRDVPSPICQPIQPNDAHMPTSSRNMKRSGSEIRGLAGFGEGVSVKERARQNRRSSCRRDVRRHGCRRLTRSDRASAGQPPGVARSDPRSRPGALAG